ncbi:right-handed parallel beta-helix repeat-containing protein [Candidatus Kaiserbacteria bacterium]|nr:right-handed parallel beta-helix repeat-containing protein [Candidatus Kaiserbacteria bacterium]
MHTSIPSKVAPLISLIAFALLAYAGVTLAAGPTCSVPGDYATIQDAINDAGCTTINVAAGTYAENITLNRSVNLKGAQNGVDARGRVASESIIAPVSGAGITLVTGSAGATVDGFTISGGAQSILSTSGPLDGLSILNNRIIGFTGNGMFLNDSGKDINIDKNEIDGISQTGSGDVVHLDTDSFAGLWFTNNNVVNGHATGFFVDGNHNVGISATPRSPKMTGNLFQANVTGANLGSRAFGFGDISGNTFKNNSFPGLQGGIQDTTITNNTFDGNGRGGLELTSFGNTAVDRGGQRDTITLNTFIGNGATQSGEGIFLSAGQAAGTISTNVINRNSIAGNAKGIAYSGTESINAECNWWGSSSGPGPIGPGSGDSVGTSVTIDYTPWLTTSDLAGPCNGPLPPITVKIEKYIDGAHATIASGNNSDFPMLTTFNSVTYGNAVDAPFTLGPAGWGSDPAYEASFANANAGSDYATHEVTSESVVGASCAEDKPFALEGYTTGETLSDAQSGTPSTSTIPSFTNITSDKYVIVWNKTCPPATLTIVKKTLNGNDTFNFTVTGPMNPAVPALTTVNGWATSSPMSLNPGTYDVNELTPPAGWTFKSVSCVYENQSIGTPIAGGEQITVHSGDEVICTFVNGKDVKVTIVKNISGVHATAGNAGSAAFPMTASWNAVNLGGAGSGNYALSTIGFNTPNAYEAVTSDMTNGSSYTTNEDTTTPVVGPNCANGQQFKLVGYTTGNTLAQAQAGTPHTLIPNFGNITVNKWVVVWNTPCPPPPPPANACTLSAPPTGYTLRNGSPGNDIVTLVPFTMFKGNGGNDVVKAGTGDYIVCTGAGNDIITLGSGNATIDALGGQNTIKTGDGNAFISTGNGNNTISTGDGNHTITTGNGNDTIKTGGGSDIINAGNGQNAVNAGGGNDTVTTGTGNDAINGGPGIDSCNPGSGSNSLVNCE